LWIGVVDIEPDFRSSDGVKAVHVNVAGIIGGNDTVNFEASPSIFVTTFLGW